MGEGTQRISRTCSWSRERERGEGDRKWHAFKEFQLARAPRLTPLLLRSPFGQAAMEASGMARISSDPHMLRSSYPVAPTHEALLIVKW